MRNFAVLRSVAFLVLWIPTIATVKAQLSDQPATNLKSQNCIDQWEPFEKEACDPHGDEGGPSGLTCRQMVADRRRCDAHELSAGLVRPKYLVLGILYAAPGCTSVANAQCGAESTVDYGAGSLLGTQVGINQNIVSNHTVLTLGTISEPSVGAFDGTQFNVSFASGSYNIGKSASKDISVFSTGDGIDHTQDQIVLILNPEIAVGLISNLVDWKLGPFAGDPAATATPYLLPVKYLIVNTVIPDPIRTVLDAAGITKADLRQMLALDPLAHLDHPVTAADLSPDRFVKTTTLDYEPPSASECAGGTCTCSIRNTLFNDLTLAGPGSAVVPYTMDATYSPDTTAPPPPDPTQTVPALSAFNSSTAITFSSSVTSANAQSNTSSANLQMACPSPSWTGATLVDVYWDKVFGSFAFVLRGLSASQQLLVSQPAPALPLSHAVRPSPQLELFYAGQKIDGVPAENGTVKFFGAPVAGENSAIVHVKGQKKNAMKAVSLP